MSNLGDYIGQILSEMATARVQADLQAVRLADIYATHPLLKAFPVPRFRLPTVTLDVPVAVSDVGSPAEPGTAKSGINAARAQKAFQAALESQLKRSDVKLTAGVKSKLSTALRERFRELGHTEFPSTSAVHVADSVTGVVEKYLASFKLEPDARNAFISGLRDAARVALVKLLPTPPRVRVLTNTAQLRELGPLEFLTRLQLNVTEQGVEWKGEDGGKKHLVPE